MDKLKNMAKKNVNEKDNWQTINRGKPIYYKNIEHFISFEMENHFIISMSKDLSKCFSVLKSDVSFKKLNK
jgi:hypothetical protein